jgi:hypothetical protein
VNTVVQGATHGREFARHGKMDSLDSKNCKDRSKLMRKGRIKRSRTFHENFSIRFPFILGAIFPDLLRVLIL